MNSFKKRQSRSMFVVAVLFGPILLISLGSAVLEVLSRPVAYFDEVSNRCVAVRNPEGLHGCNDGPPEQYDPVPVESGMTYEMLVNCYRQAQLRLDAEKPRDCTRLPEDYYDDGYLDPQLVSNPLTTRHP